MSYASTGLVTYIVGVSYFLLIKTTRIAIRDHELKVTHYKICVCACVRACVCMRDTWLRDRNYSHSEQQMIGKNQFEQSSGDIQY